MSHPITSPPTMPSSSATPSATKHHKCSSKQWFGLVCVDPSPTSTAVSTETPAPTTEPPRRQQCRRRSWLGYCKEWEDVGEDPVQEI
jgi:lipase ATG15